jgi:glycerophosphoryl diester phosphodiesterase
VFSGASPENTLESFELAFELGAPVVELDVHLTKDKKLVVIHDDTLDRTTDAAARGARGRPVSHATLDELRALDAGRWFTDALEKKPLPPPWGPTDEERRRHLDSAALARYASGQVRVPSLEDVLALAKRRDRFVNVELKAIPRFYEGLAAAAVEAVKAMKMEDRVVFSSFDHRTLVETKQLAPRIATGALTVERLHEPGRYVREFLAADAWLPGCVGEVDVIGFHSVAFEARGFAGLDASGVASAHAAGAAVVVWTENDPARQRALAQLGVDGIITDFPGRIPTA